MFTEDGGVLHFNAPKVQAAVGANTYARSPVEPCSRGRLGLAGSDESSVVGSLRSLPLYAVLGPRFWSQGTIPWRRSKEAGTPCAPEPQCQNSPTPRTRSREPGSPRHGSCQ